MKAIVALWLGALPVTLALSFAAWAISTVRRNVGLVDVFWSLFLLSAATAFAFGSPPGARGWIALGLIVAWSLRLAAHLAARNWNATEDRRYRAIRARNEPGFAWKSLYLVFGLQAVLAWVISAPLAAAIAASGPLGALDWAGAALAAFGILYEAIADAQLAHFTSRSTNAGRVLDSGLWRYSRHPNYFGEFCVWWGLYLLAAGGGGWWTVFSPLLVSVLLLRVSGVTLLEKDISERRPEYRNYARRTQAFFPGPPREA